MTRRRNVLRPRMPWLRLAFVLAVVFAGPRGALFARADDAPDEQPSAPTLERVTSGYDPWISPLATRLAFQRTGLDLENRDERGQPLRCGILHVRDLATGKERRAAIDGDVTSWSGEDVLIFASGSSLDLRKGGEGPRFPRAPEGLHTPAWARSPDGQRVAFTVRGFRMEDVSPLTAREGREHTIHLVDDQGPVRSLPLGAYVDHSNAKGLLAFSPDGRRLAFHVGFMHTGQLPHRRIGVIDLERGAYAWIADEAADVWDRHTTSWPWGPTAWSAWDAQGTRFVFVKAAGAAKRDLWTATADGGDLRRLTKDGAWKGMPCLSPDGDRCAFWGEAPPSDEGEEPLRGLIRLPTRRHALRVLFLRTGEVVALPTPGRGSGDHLQWTPDGAHLWFGWAGRNPGIWRVAAPPSPEVPEQTQVVDMTVSPRDLLLEGLASEDPREAEATVRRAWNDPDPRITEALIALLERWTRNVTSSGRVWTVVQAIRHRRAVAAIPVLLHALTHDGWTGTVTGLLLDWQVADGVPAWRRLARSPEAHPRGWATVALARFGDTGAWDRVRACLEDPDEDVAWAVARALAHVREPRSIDVLLSMLADQRRVYNEVVVADLAVKTLRDLTGQDLGRDRAAWIEWWKSRDGRLPDPQEAGR